jgi:glycosyltransferase involved in cell wall biosynthesis
VSVIIPAYNAEKFIEKTLGSVTNQTYQDLEIIVIDDGSQDQTAEIVKKMAKQDSRISLLQQINSGVAAARNLGIEKAQGEFIAPIDADDLWCVDNLQKQVQCLLNSDPSVGLTYAWSVDIDENDIPRGEFRASTIEGKVYTILLLHDFIANASSTLIRRSVFEKVGVYSSYLKSQDAQGGEDLELYLRIAEAYEFRVIREFLVGYRKLSNSMSSNYETMAKSRLVIWQSVFAKYPRIPKVIYRLSMSSFYMYLARQSSLYGRHQKTLFWLYKALKSDLITPYLRLGLYTLFIKSCFYLIVEKATEERGLERNFLSQLASKNQSSATSIKFVDLKISTINEKGIKSWAEKILAQLIPLIFGTPNQWKQSEDIIL